MVWHCISKQQQGENMPLHETARCSLLWYLQVVDMHLEGGMATVTAAVKQCLQFYVNANAITAKTEASLRALIASLGGSNEQES